MVDRNEKVLLELLKIPGNNSCADCGSRNEEGSGRVHRSWWQDVFPHCLGYPSIVAGPHILHTQLPLAPALEYEYSKMYIPIKMRQTALTTRTSSRSNFSGGSGAGAYMYPEWASYNLGIFICTRCSGVHRSMGVHISKVKHLKLDRWEDSQVERMKEVGNTKSKLKYEERVPPCYRRPKENDPQVLIEQWIRAKYQREEFCQPQRQTYTSGYMEGFLMKRGKEDSKYHSRKFVLSEAENTLKYFVRENKYPKAVLEISDLNVVFAPEKMEYSTSLQITFLKYGTTRHIYVYHEDGEVITNWYMAIRCAKLHRLQVAYPSANEADLLGFLTEDFAKEGWLWKTGPRTSDGFKKRWFTLDNRKLMYHDEPLDAHPKGEIFLGHSMDGYSVRIGVSAGVKDQGFSFALTTPDRVYNLSAQTESERDEWIEVIERVLERPITHQDATICARLVRKRANTNSISRFSPR